MASFEKDAYMPALDLAPDWQCVYTSEAMYSDIETDSHDGMEYHFLTYEKIDKIKKEIGNDKVTLVLVTHNHFDHVGALSYFDRGLVYDFSNLEEKEYEIGNFRFKVIFTPGHSSDSVSYYFEDINSLFCGDFIFYENIGRCDLPSGDFTVMQESINKIREYPRDMKIYPGHGMETTLSHEIMNNMYFEGK